MSHDFRKGPRPWPRKCYILFTDVSIRRRLHLFQPLDLLARRKNPTRDVRGLAPQLVSNDFDVSAILALRGKKLEDACFQVFPAFPSDRFGRRGLLGRWNYLTDQQLALQIVEDVL